MRARELYIAGTGSFALEVAEYAQTAGFRVAGLVELIDSSRVGSRIHELDVIALDDDRRHAGVAVISFRPRVGRSSRIVTGATGAARASDFPYAVCVRFCV